MMRRIVLAGLIASFAVLAVAESAYADHRRRGRRASVYINTPYFSAYYGRAPRRAYWANYGNPYYGRYYGRTYWEPGYYSSSPWYAESGTMPYRSFYAGPSNGRQAEIIVRVPDADADVWFGDKETETKGFDRAYVTKDLDGTYIYKVKASWMENGQEITREKKVEVEPGEQVVVAFGERDGSERPSAERIPLPEEKGIRTAAPMRGKIVRVNDGELVMSELDGNNEHTHRLAANAKIVIDGRDAQLQDLKAGDEVRVTMSGDELKTASRIEVTKRDGAEFGGANGERPERVEPIPE